MKYEPANKLNPENATEWLMMPFAITEFGNDWEMIDMIQETLSTLSEADQAAIQGIYYERQTYQELAETLSIRAKSHAWRKADSALKNLRKAILNNEELMSVLREKYGDIDEAK